MVDGVDADDGETCPFGVFAAETYEAIAVLALTASVTEEEQPTGAGRFVDARRDAAQQRALLVHVPTLRANRRRAADRLGEEGLVVSKRVTTADDGFDEQGS